MALSKIDGTNLITGLPAGSVLQTVQTLKTDTYSSTANGFNDVTGLSVAITPSSSSNKVFVVADVAMGLSDFYSYNWVFKVLRDSTSIGVHSGATTDASGGGNLYLSGGSYPYLFGNAKFILDSPSSTSSLTYKIQANKISASATLYLNRKGSDTSVGAVSSITAMEIAG